MSILKKEGYKKEDILPFGNMFLIGNGHIGYRGTLEEYSKEEVVGLNMIGLYDKYGSLWRESLNFPNPLHIRLYLNDKQLNILDDEAKHTISLNLTEAIFKRNTINHNVKISSERFIPFLSDDYLVEKYQVSVIDDNYSLKVGLDLDVYEINGPHYVNKEVTRSGKTLFFKGITNENKIVYETVNYVFNNEYEYNDGYYRLRLHKGVNTIYICSHLNSAEEVIINRKEYEICKHNHIQNLKRMWDDSKINIVGDRLANFNLEYSIYHLLILGNPYHEVSIPARGLSGQTYKGAIFWDTEIFMLPFFTLTNPKVASKLIKYRINTLEGALRKAKEFGYEGAFYAWESQDTGDEACSKYNITDPITGDPIRTYFNEKQIHISADIVYGIINYVEITGDYSILDKGARSIIEEVARFNMSYAKLKEDGKYHFDDVIGPDEYHERVDDNAYTSYMIYFTLLQSIKYLKNQELIKKIRAFAQLIYLPPIKNNLIEQFKGYFKLKESSLDEIRSKLRHPNEYWGFIARDTKIIKQADLITLLVLYRDKFSKEEKLKNFNYYYKRTEHGSSLSSSMYAILAFQLGKVKIGYDNFMKSASIDLGLNQKMYAGGIFIGGTHPAASGGSYLSILFGMCGLKFNNDKISLEPNLPKKVRKITFKIYYQKKHYLINVTHDNYQVEEIND